MEISFLSLFLYGVLSFLSPCFFPLFPSFLAYVFADENSTRSLIAASVCTLGIVISFAVYGSLFWFLFTPLAIHGSLLRQVFGLAMILLGVSMLTPLKKVFTRIRSPQKIQELKGFLGAFVLGFSYVLIAAPCAMPIFLSALFLTATLENMLYAVLGSTVFASGAGLSLIVSSFAAANARDLLMKTYRSVGPWFEFISATLLISTGLLLSLSII